MRVMNRLPVRPAMPKRGGRIFYPRGARITIQMGEAGNTTQTVVSLSSMVSSARSRERRKSIQNCTIR